MSTHGRNFRRIGALVAGGAAVLLLVGCGEKPQKLEAHKSEAASWTMGDEGAFAAPGYKATDQAAWESQLRQRLNGQNDYLRMH